MPSIFETISSHDSPTDFLKKLTRCRVDQGTRPPLGHLHPSLQAQLYKPQAQHLSITGIPLQPLLRGKPRLSLPLSSMPQHQAQSQHQSQLCTSPESPDSKRLVKAHHCFCADLLPENSSKSDEGEDAVSVQVSSLARLLAL
jgi:hypothetical protein